MHRLRNQQAVKRVGVKRWERGNLGCVHRTNRQFHKADFLDQSSQANRIGRELAQA